MSYSQLIQFKRLEERAFIFLNGRQVIFAAGGGMLMMPMLDGLGITGLPMVILGAIGAILGIAAGGIYRGLYGYQYLWLLFKNYRSARLVQPEDLYHRSFEEDQSFTIKDAEGKVVVSYRPPAGGREHQRTGSTDGATVFKLRPVDLSQYPPQSMGALFRRWSGFWAGVRLPLRMTVHSTPFKAETVVQELRKESLIARQRWRAQALSAYSRFMEELVTNSAMYQAEHDLIVWSTTDTEADATAGSLAGYLGVGSEAGEIAPLIRGEYELGVDHLRPLDTQEPFIILMVSHELMGDWSWTEPLVSILRQPFPVSVTIDVDRTLPSNQALRKLVQFENVVVDVLSNNKGSRDPKAEGALQDIQLAMARANAGQSLHFVTVIVAVKGDTLEDARRNVAAIRMLTGSRLSLVVLPGGQGELLKFFTTTKRSNINLPEISHNVTSDGMAVMSGMLGFRRRSETHGIFWGLGSSGGHDTYPIWWSGFGRDPDKPAAYHGMFIGKSGGGKTVGMNSALYREAENGTQVILMEPQGHSRRLIDMVGSDGASYNPLSLRTMQVNPLDPISDDLSEQKDFQISLYRLMLKQVDPQRRLTMQEAGLLDAALTMVYDGIDNPLKVRPEHVPRLEQLCFYLKKLGAMQLALDLELNYVQGSMGQIYNQPTNLDIALNADVVAYDFKDVPESSRSLIYTMVLGRIQRIVRSTGRIRRRIVAIDEFGWLAQEPMLTEVVAMWIKTFRTFGTGIWVAEQDLIRLTGGQTGDMSGHSIIGNSVFQVFFYHEPAAAELVAQTFPNVAPYREMLESFRRPQDTGVAEAILRIPDGVYHTYMVLTRQERAGLIGS